MFIVEWANALARFRFAASSKDADSIFERAREVGFPIQDEKLKAFIESLRE
jgi:hypothetical protein